MARLQGIEVDFHFFRVGGDDCEAAVIGGNGQSAATAIHKYRQFH